MHGAIEAFAIETVSIDITKEIAGGDRRSPTVERDDDPAEAGVDRNRNEIFLRCGRQDRGDGSLGEGGRGETGEQRDGKESVLHGHAA